MNLKKNLYFIFLVIFVNNIAICKLPTDTLKLKTMKDDTAKVNLLNQLAEELKDFNSEQGLNYAQKALELSQKLNYKSGIGSAFKALGINYYRMGVYDASLSNSLKASQIFSEINEKILLCRTLNNIGLVYSTRNDFTTSKKYFQKGLTIANQTNNEIEKSRILHNIALIEFYSGNIKTALKIHLQSLKFAEKKKEKMLIIYNYISLSNCYLKLEDFNLSFKNIIKAIEISEQYNNPNLKGIAYNQLAFFYLKIQKYDKTLENAKKAYNIAEINRNRYLRLESFNLITEAYTQLKDFKKALEFSSKSNLLSDSMKNESNIKSIAYIEAKFEYDKKLKEIEINKQQEIKYSNFITKIAVIISILLFLVSITLFQFYRLKSKTYNILIKKNKEIIELNKKLNTSNSTKDKFFSIIAHDLKNPFNSIMGFSELLIEQIKENDLEGIDKYAEIIQQSSHNAMDLLTNLLEWSQSQTGHIEFNPEYLELNGLINNVIALLENQAMQKSIKINKTTTKTLTLRADKDMLSTILRNLISNAIKFTNTNGEIHINAEQKNNQTIIKIKDNGIGINKNTLNKLFRIEENISSKGTNNEKGTGLGLVLCKEFIEKHGGEIWAESEEGIGSCFYFSIPQLNMVNNI